MKISLVGRSRGETSGVVGSYCVGEVRNVNMPLLVIKYLKYARFVNIGGGNRPFAAHDAKSDDLLPMDEDIWDKGVCIGPITKRKALLKKPGLCSYSTLGRIRIRHTANLGVCTYMPGLSSLVTCSSPLERKK